MVRAECIFADNLIEYTGLSDQFIEIEVGQKIPEYRIEITSETDDKTKEDKIIKVVANRVN